MKKVTLTLKVPTVKVPKIKKPNVKHHVQKNQKHYIIFGFLSFMAVFLMSIALIIDSQRPKMMHMPDPKKAQEKEKQKVLGVQQTELQKIKKEVKLPTDEQPIFATIAQKEQLQKQNFFKKAQNGDRVLLFPKHKKVYLYRPSTQKVIAISKLKYQDAISPTPQPTIETAASASADTISPAL